MVAGNEAVSAGKGGIKKNLIRQGKFTVATWICMPYSFDNPLAKCRRSGGNFSAGKETNMNIQDTLLPPIFDRIKFAIQNKYGGFIVSEELYEGPRMVTSKELGIVYANHYEAMRAIDSLTRLSKSSKPDKFIGWTE